jgi:iron complex outermembrane receptor protein
MRLAGRLVFGALIAGAAASPALAQQAPNPPAQSQPADDAPDVVIVTGVGPARSSDEMIASTTALSADDILDRLEGGLGDTLAGLPGISSTSFGPGASRPIIRGLGAERVQVLTNGIGVIDASAASPDHAVTSDPLGAERIEILRGPASLAYGGGATGGVVNVIDGLIVDRLPEQAFSGMAYGALTSADQGQQYALHMTGKAGAFVGVLNGSYLDTDNVDIPGYALSQAARDAAVADGADPASFAHGTLPNSAVRNQALSGGLSWVGDTAFFGVGVRRMENRYGIVAEENAFIDMEQTRYDARGGIKFDDGFLKSVTASGSVVDYEHTEFEGPGEPGTVFTSSGWEARIEAQHHPIGDIEGSVGVQASDRDFAAEGDEALIGPTNTRSTGVFVYETYDAGMWGVEGGLRYDDVRVNNVDAGVRQFEPVNASFGAHVHLGDWFLGASIARTARAPTDIELFANGPHPATGQFEIGDEALGIEEGINTELSARWEGPQVNLSGSVYRFDFDSFTYLEDTGLEEDDLPVFRFVQAGAVFTGIELAADADLGSLWDIAWKADGSVDFVRAKLDAGGDLPLIPPMTVNAGLEGRRGIFTGRVSAQYGAKQDDVAAFETPTDSYLTFDARLGIDLTDAVQLSIEGRNLTDEEVRVHASPLKEIAPQPGRSVRIALRAKF